VTDTIRVTPVDQMVLKGGDYAAVVEGFTEQQGTAVTGGALAVELNADEPVAGRSPGGIRFHP